MGLADLSALSITRLNSKCAQAESHSFLEAQGENPFPGTCRFLAGSVPCGCRTEIPTPLLADS